MANSFEGGTDIQINCKIALSDGTPHNPTALSFSCNVPGYNSPTVITYTYPEPDGIQVLRQAKDTNNSPIVGSYYIIWPTTVAGTYSYLFTASGDVGITKRGTFTVNKWS